MGVGKMWTVWVVWLSISPVYTQLIIDLGAIKDMLEGINGPQKSSFVNLPQGTLPSTNTKYMVIEDPSQSHQYGYPEDRLPYVDELQTPALVPIEGDEDRSPSGITSSNQHHEVLVEEETIDREEEEEKGVNEYGDGDHDGYQSNQKTTNSNQDDLSNVAAVIDHPEALFSEDEQRFESSGEDVSEFRLFSTSSALAMMVKRAREKEEEELENQGERSKGVQLLSGTSDIENSEGDEEESTQSINLLEHEFEFQDIPRSLWHTNDSQGVEAEEKDEGLQLRLPSVGFTVSQEPTTPEESQQAYYEQYQNHRIDQQPQKELPPTLQNRKHILPQNSPLPEEPEAQFYREQMLRQRQDLARKEPGMQSLLQYILQEHDAAAMQQEHEPDTEMDLPSYLGSSSSVTDTVDTFNIVITKNLTGGQSQPTVQYLSDAKVDAMLLNTTINSVNNVQALKQVVHQAISTAIERNPVAFEEAIAQVVERPGYTPTVNVVNSTIPDLGQLEATINSLLGSDVVYEKENRQDNTAYGYIPHPDGSVVNRLFNNTIGVENLNLNSTSKTNVVNIFIINIIGGTDSSVSQEALPSFPTSSPDSEPTESVDFSRPSPTSIRVSELPVGPFKSTIANSPILKVGPFPSEKPEEFFAPSPPSEGFFAPSPPSEGFFAPSPPLEGFFAPSPPPEAFFASSPPPEGLYTLPPFEVRPPAIPIQPEILIPSSIPSSLLPHPGFEGITTSEQGAASVVTHGTFTNEFDNVSTENTNSTLHSGIILNHNYVLNLLPEFIKATTIPPVVPLYNTTAHNNLGQKPSVLGLLPNQLFNITRPMIDYFSNSTSGGVIRLKSVGGLREYFNLLSPPLSSPSQEASQQPTSGSSQGLIQYSVYDNPNISQPPPISSNPHPFRLLTRYYENEFRNSQNSPQYYSAGGARENSQNFVPTPVHGMARRPMPHQSQFQEFNIASENQIENKENPHLVQLFRNDKVNDTDLSSHQEPLESQTENTTIDKSKKEKKQNTKKQDQNIQSTIERVASDAVAAAGGQMDNLMKAVAIGALPSGIAFATALWPYWAPMLLGRRRKRDVMTSSEARDQSGITVDWLSILTGTKYKSAGTDFPTAWDRATLKRKNNQYRKKEPSTVSEAGNQKQSADSSVLSKIDLTTFRNTMQESSPVTSTELSMISTNPQGVSVAEKVTKPNLKKITATSEVDKPTSQNKTTELHELVESTTFSEKDVESVKDGSVSDVIRTTEKATTVKRSTPANLAKTTSKDNEDQSFTNVIPSLSSRSSSSEPVTPQPVTPVNNPDNDVEEEKEDGNPADVALVTNFLYSAIHGWNNNEKPGAGKEIPATTKEEFSPANANEFIDLELMTNTPQQMISGTNSPIVFINGVPMIPNRNTAISRPSTTLGLRPIYSLQQTTIPALVTDRTPFSTLSSPSIFFATFPSRRPATASSKPIVFVNNQPMVTADTFQTSEVISSTASIQIQTATPKPSTSQSVNVPIEPAWITRRTATTKSPVTRIDPPVITVPPTNSTTTTTTTTPTTTTPTTTTPTTTISTTTTLPPVRQVTTSSTTTTTTTEPTTTVTTTTPVPGFMESITSAFSDPDGQLQQAVGFVSSVALYGAAALMPLWLPIVLGKKRRKRDLQMEDDIQEILEAITMVQNPPEVGDENVNYTAEDKDKKISSKKYISDGVDSDEDLIDIYKHYPSVKKLAQYLKKEFQNRRQNK